MGPETQAHLKAVAKLQLVLLVQLKLTKPIQSLLEAIANVPQIDLIYNFLKALHKQIGTLKQMDGVDPKIFQTVSHFLLHGIIKKDLQPARSNLST